MSLFISDESGRTSSVTDLDSTTSAGSKSSKKADLAGPGIGNYAELEKILPQDYNPLPTPKETQKAIYHLHRYIEDNLCKELGIRMVQVPLIVEVESGVNDVVDRDGTRRKLADLCRKSINPQAFSNRCGSPRSFSAISAV